MNYPNLIVLARHGQSEGNLISPDDVSFESKANHRFSLTELGVKQCKSTGEYLRSTFGGFDAYFHSSFSRTKESLGFFYPDAAGIEDPRLDEWWRGIWHSLSAENIERHYPAEKAVMEREGRYHYRAPGGESCPDVELRIRSFIATLRADWSYRNVFISGHGNWIILFDKIMRGLSVDEAMGRCKRHVVKNASVTAYRFQWGDTAPKLTMEHVVP